MVNIVQISRIAWFMVRYLQGLIPLRWCRILSNDPEGGGFQRRRSYKAKEKHVPMCLVVCTQKTTDFLTKLKMKIWKCSRCARLLTHTMIVYDSYSFKQMIGVDTLTVHLYLFAESSILLLAPYNALIETSLYILYRCYWCISKNKRLSMFITNLSFCMRFTHIKQQDMKLSRVNRQ